MADPSPAPTRIVTAAPSFNLIFITVTALTVLSLIAAILLVIFGPDKPGTDRLVETCSKGFMLGLGAIVGLIGGKALP